MRPTLVLLPLLLLVACGGDAADAPDVPPAATGSAAGVPPFADITEAAGVILENVSGDPDEKMAIVENLGQGGCVLDYDGDGKLDLFVANGDVFDGQTPRANPRCALYRAAETWRFEDVTEQAGLIFKGWCHGASAVDFDADGHTDLYLTIYGGPNRFFRNLGNGRFEDWTKTWGGGDEGPSTAACFFDADQDGDLDLYVGNYVIYDPKNPPNGGRPCPWKNLMVSCGPRGTPPAPDTFYANEDGKLVERTREFGFEATATYALGLVSGDLDDDGDPDLYVANDSRPNYLFVNQGGGKFVERGFELGVSMSEMGEAQAGMGTDMGDVDGDGRLDLFVTNFSQDNNTLYQNTRTRAGDLLFVNNTAQMGLKHSSHAFLSWGTRILDINLDGRNDILVASGHIYPQVNDAPQLGTTYEQANQLFLNRGKQNGEWVRFDDVAEQAGDFFYPGVSRGLITWDPDHDGDLDLAVIEMDHRPTLLRNDLERGNAWVGFHLIGKDRNREAIGARITITDASGTRRVMERSGGGSYLCTGDPRLHFGLGSARGKLKEVRIRWPRGEELVFQDVETGTYWRVDEATSKRSKMAR